MPKVFSSYKCPRCGVVGPESGFYENLKLKRGHNSWCVKCSTERTLQKRKEKRDSEIYCGTYVDGRKCRPKMSDEEQAISKRNRSRRHYYKNIEETRRKRRELAKANRDDPIKSVAIKFRKRAGGAGLTQEQWDAIFDSQGRRCAICESTEPRHSHGWNTDHCHRTGAVRFILCAHCNRGLGAFRDSPDLMRKAADVLQAFYQGQADRPVAAIMEAQE